MRKIRMYRGVALLMALCLLCAPALSGLAQAPAPGMSAQAFLTALLQGDRAEELYALLSPTMQASVSAADFSALPGQLASLGALLGFEGDAVQTAQGGLTAYVQRVLFENAAIDMTYVLDADNLVSGLFFAPAKQAAATQQPVAPEGCTEEACTVGEGRFSLPGTLSLPLDLSAPVPAVVLVHGSGPNDRDETAGNNKLFRDLAHFLAQNGFAVLRYDKRTYAHGAQMTREDIASLTVWEETEEDAILAGKLLMEDPRIDSARIFLIGHSMGAMLAPDILAQSGDVFAGGVLLCGTPHTLLEVVIAQNEEAIAKLPEDARAMYTAQLDADKALTEGLYAMDDAQLRAGTAFGASLLYWASFPEDVAGQVLASDKPFLIINGGEDFQVSDKLGADAWHAALDAAQRDTVTILRFAQLNHMLARYTGDESARYTTAEYDTPAAPDAEALGALLDWLQNETKR